MKTNGCEGCKGQCKTTSVFLTADGEKVYCPCQICIVKVVCVLGCDNFSEFVESQDGE